MQLVDPLAIMHVVDEMGGANPLRSNTKMSTTMTVFLAYALVGSNANAFKPKRNNNNKQGRKGKDEPNTLDPSMYSTLVFLSDVDPNIIILHVTHEFCRAGGFYFWKKQRQCVETATPFIIYYLYTFNDIATLWEELTSLLEEVHQGMQDNLMLPEEFEHAKVPEINIRWGVTKLPGQPGNHFLRLFARDARSTPGTSDWMQCECNLFFWTLISYMKERKLTAPIWGGHTHITETVDWDSPKGDISQFIQMLQDHTCYNMSVISIEVRGILDLEASAEILCPTTGNVLGHLSLRQTLMATLCALSCISTDPRVWWTWWSLTLQQQKLVLRCLTSIQLDICIMSSLPLVPPPFCQEHPPSIYGGGFDDRGAFVHVWSQNADSHDPLRSRARRRSLRCMFPPLLPGVLANKQAADDNKKGRKKKHSTPKMCFQIGSSHSVQTMHGANDRKYSKVTEPGIDLSSATQASAAKPSNADQPVIKVASTDDNASSSDGSEEGSNSLSFSDNTSVSSSSEEEEQSVTLAGSG